MNNNINRTDEQDLKLLKTLKSIDTLADLLESTRCRKFIKCYADSKDAYDNVEIAVCNLIKDKYSYISTNDPRLAFYTLMALDIQNLKPSELSKLVILKNLFILASYGKLINEFKIQVYDTMSKQNLLYRILIQDINKLKINLLTCEDRKNLSTIIPIEININLSDDNYTHLEVIMPNNKNEYFDNVYNFACRNNTELSLYGIDESSVNVCTRPIEIFLQCMFKFMHRKWQMLAEYEIYLSDTRLDKFENFQFTLDDFDCSNCAQD